MRDMASLLQGASQNELKLILAGVEQKLAEKGCLTPSRHPGGTVVSVPDTTKYLSSEKLETATSAFSEWRRDSPKPVQARARSRLWLVFVFIRYGALRLGEVLALDDAEDLCPDRCLVRVSGSHPREVLLPRDLMREISDILSAPMCAGMRGEIFRLDPGYVRRKFYERAKACGLAPAMFNPRTLRHSRAIELLQGGIPLQVVQTYLGQQDLNMTGHYLEFSGETSHRIVQQYLIREKKMKTSARNAFTGAVTRIVHDGLLVEVELETASGLPIVAVITDESAKSLRLMEGSIVTAIVKAPWVILNEYHEAVQSSARNRFSGTVEGIKTSNVASEVIVTLADGTNVCALITKESVENLKLAPGVAVQVLFKAFSVILNAE